MYTTAGGNHNARIPIVARISILAGRSTPASVGIAVTANASVAGRAIMSALGGDGGEVAAMSGHTPVAQSKSVDGMNGVAQIGSADGAGHAAGSDLVPRGMCAGGRNRAK